MATPGELEAKIKQITEWDGLRYLWEDVKSGTTPGWEPDKAFEYLVVRAFELDPREATIVRYPYEVRLFGERVEQIDGAVYLSGLPCLIETKDWGKNVAIEPIVKLRSQLLRRPAGTIGIMFSSLDFTDQATCLAHFAMPQAVLLWSRSDLDVALAAGEICRFLRVKHRACCEYGVPDYDLVREE